MSRNEFANHSVNFPHQQQSDGGTDQSTNLYVTNLAPSIDDRSLRTTFEKFGNILSSKVIVDIHTGDSKGFGFVEFSTATEAQAAIQELNGSLLLGHCLAVRVADRTTRRPGAPTSKVFIRNVPADISERQVRELCDRWGTVIECMVQPDVMHGLTSYSAPTSQENSTEGGPSADGFAQQTQQRLRSQLAHVTMSTPDQAKRLAENVDRSNPWPSCQTMVLAKVVDGNQAERKRRQKGSQPGSQQQTQSGDGYGACTTSSGGSAAAHNGNRPLQPFLQPQTMQPTMTTLQPGPFQQQPILLQQPQQQPSMVPVFQPSQPGMTQPLLFNPGGLPLLPMQAQQGVPGQQQPPFQAMTTQQLQQQLLQQQLLQQQLQQQMQQLLQQQQQQGQLSGPSLLPLQTGQGQGTQPPLVSQGDLGAQGTAKNAQQLLSFTTPTTNGQSTSGDVTQ